MMRLLSALIIPASLFLIACSGGGGEAIDDFIGDVGGDDGGAADSYPLDFDPASHNFGTLKITAVTPLSQTVTVTNNNPEVLYINSVSGTSLDFTITGETCTAIVAGLSQGATCTFVVEFLPTTSGAKSFSATVTYGLLPTDADLTNSATFTGFGAAPASLTISNGPTFDYGSVVVTGLSSKSFTVTNTGNIDATLVSGGGLSGSFAFKGGSYPGTGGTCSGTIAGGASCTIVADFSPSATGLQTDTIELSYDDGDTVQMSTRNIQGTGATAAVLALSDGPGYDFGNLPAGAGADKTLTLTNSGGVTATAVAGSGLAAPFSFKGGVFPGTGGNCAATLAAGANCTVVVRYAPTVTGLQSDTVDIAYNDGLVVQSTSRALQGTGVAPASISISNAPNYNYGTVVIGSASDATLTLTNSGGYNASFLSGTGLAAPFTFKGGTYPGTGGTCAGNLAASSSCTVVITYTPTAVGSQSDTADFSYNNGVSAQTVSRTLQGTAVQPANITLSLGNPYDFGTKPVGSVSEVTITATNSGGSTATAMIGTGLAAPFDFKGGSYPGTGGTCGATLGAAANCTMVVTFSPVGVGTPSDILDLNYNNALIATVVSKSLQGTAVSAANLSISDGPTYDYGTQPVGLPVDKVFTVTNSGGYQASALSASGLAAPFVFKGGSYPGTGGTCGATLNGSSACTLVVTFTGVTPGNPADQLDLDYNDGVTTQSVSRAMQATVVNPGLLSVSDGPTYNFGAVANGGAAEKIFTITNTGSFAVSTMTGSGLAAPFTFKGGTYPGTGGDCGAVLAPAGTCTVVVRFAPTSLGTRTDTLNINYNNGVSAQVASRDLQGIGAAPANLSFSDGPTYNFGTKPVGSTTSKTFTVTNTGGVTADSMVGGGLAAPYSFQGGSYPGTGGTCAATLAATATCTVVVDYSPSAAGAVGDTITLDYNNTVSAQQATRGVTGTGVTPANLSFSGGPTYDFGTVAIGGGSAEATLTVTNSGQTAATGVSASGLAAPFDFKGGSYPGTGGTCAATLNASATCTVVLVYAPSATGVQNDTILLDYNDGVAAQQATRPLQGTGATTATLAISDGAVYDFGTLPINASADKTFTLSNSGGVTATGITGSGLAAPFTFKGGAFPGTGGTCTTSLAASTSCTFVVRFSPTATGTPTDTINIGYNDGVNPQSTSRDLAGTAVNPANLSLSDGPLYSFGTLPSGGSGEKTFTLTNSGDVTATTITGTGLAAPFTFKGGTFPGTGGTCGGSLAAGGNCTIVVVFAPASNGTFNDTMIVNYNNGVGAGSTNRAIQGVGAAPGILAISDGPTYNFGSKPNGSISEKTFTVSNSGGVAASAMAGSGLATPFTFKGGTYPGAGGTCTTSLNAGANCTMVVEYNPSSLGGASDSIVLDYNNGLSAQQTTRAVTGTSVAPASLAFSDGPTYDYNTVAIGASADKTFTITNSGAVAASSMTGSGLAAPFTFKGGSYPGTGGNCGTTLNASASCTVVVTYTPSTTGLQSDTVSLDYFNGAINTSATRDVQGTGTTAALLSVSDGPTYDYGSIATGSTLDKTFTLTNSGGVAATGINGSGLASPFSFKGGTYPGTGGTCTASLASSGTCTFVVTYAPVANGAHADTINIGYNNGVSAGQVSSRDVQGTGLAPATLSFSDGPTYNFGTLAVGATGEKTFTVTNTGAFAASSMNGSGLATPFAFKGGSYPGTGGTCSTSLAAAGTCTVIVTFAPASATLFSDTVDLGYNNGASVQTASRNIQGTGATPASLAVSDGPTYNYGTRATGSSTDKVFTVTNSGGVTATSLTGAGIAAPYTFKGGSYPGTGGTCTASLTGAGGSCTVVVTYNPATTGTHNDTLDFDYNNGVTAQTVSRDVTGVGAAPALLGISDGPTYDYGTLAAGGTADKTFTVSNTGGVTASSMSGSGLVAPFTFKGGSYPGTGGTCAATLAASSSCTVVVSYNPSAGGAHSDTIDVAYNDGVSAQTAQRDIQGTAVTPANLAISDGATYSFGALPATGSAEKVFTITNTGTLTATSITGTGLAAPFSFKGGSFPGTGGTCGGSLNGSGSTCTMIVVFNPSVTGSFSDSIQIDYNDGAQAQQSLRPVQGTGTTAANLAISDGATYNFGSVANGGSVDKTFTITNTGGVSATSVNGSGLASPFTFKGGSYPGSGGTCSTSLAAAGTCTVVVTFNPSSLGLHSDTLDMSYNDGLAAQISSRNMQGTAVAPASLTLSDGPTYDFGTYATGATAEKTLTVTNGGAVTATTMSGSGLAAPFAFKGGSYPGTGGTCAATLNASLSCTIVVTYSPSITGLQSDTVDISYNNGASGQTASRDIQGTGAAPASLAVSDGPTYDYGSKANGSSTDYTFTITNSGGVSATAMAGSGLASPFSFKGGSYPGTAGTCSTTLAASGTCTIVVTYAPVTIATHNDTIDISYSNGVSVQNTTRAVQGTAVAPATLVFSDGPSYDFGTLANGATSEKTFTVTNSGSFTATSMGGSGLAAPFTFKGGSYPGTGGTCSTTLAAAGTCTVVVVFAPSATGSYSDTIDLSYNNGASVQTAQRDIEGAGTPPASLAVSDGATYNFGTLATGATADKTFTVTNSGGAPATSLAGGGLAAPYTFKGGSYPGTGGTCSTSLAGSGGTCTIIVTYSPSGTGTHNDTLDVSYNDGVAGQVASRDITGVGAAPASLAVSDGPTYNFGSIAVGASADKSFTITNSGGVSATSLAGSGIAAPFTFKGGSFPGTGGTCTATLTASGTCTVVVTFAPAGAGAASDTLDITYNNGVAGGQTASRDVQGTGVAPALIAISDGATYDFGAVPTTGSVDKVFTLTNSGDLSAASMAGSGLAAPFTFKGGSYPGTGGTCSTSLAASGGTCTIVVTFNPSVTGGQSDTIIISYNNGAVATQSTRDIQGTGALPANLTISDGATYNFGSIANGASADKSFTITNAGGVPATSVSGGGLAAPFTFKGGSYPGTGGTCSTSLAAAATCTVIVTYNPSSLGTQNDTLDMTFDNGLAGGQVSSRDMQGTAVAPASLAFSDGPTYDYGTIPTGGSADKTLTVTNSGAVTATAMSGSGLAAPFTFKGGSYPGTGGTCSTTLNASQTCTVVVTYSPSITGLQSDTVDLSYNNGASVQSASRDLQGTGASPALLTVSDGPTYDYGTKANGSSTDKSFTITNSGGVAAASMAGSGLAAPFSFKGGSYPGTGGTCSTSLAAAGTCTVVVTYTPSTNTTHTDTLNISYNDGVGAQTAARDIQGTSVAPATLTFSDGPTYDFGTLANGASADKTFTVTNSGSFAATSMTGNGLAAPYTFKGGTYPGTGGNCSTSLAAAGTCTVVVTFAPVSTGAHSDTINLDYNNGAGLQSATRDVTGAGTPPASLAISDGATYNYGTLATGASADKTFTITNSGGASATSIGGSGLAAPYTFKGGSYPGAGGTCTGTLAGAGATCTIVVTYSPSGTGTHNDTIDISYNDGVTTQAATRDVTGVGAAPASLAVSDGPTYNFGSIATSASADKTFTINNSGGVPATSLAGGGLAAPYSFKGGSFPGTGGNCTATLGASSSCTVVVTFAPTISGVQTDTLDITYHNGVSGGQTASRDLTGTGVAPALLSISDGATYDFGSVVQTVSVDKTFTVTNSGDLAATSLGGSGLAAPFTFKGGSYPGSGGTCSTSLAPSGATCTIVVTFTPASTGPASDTIIMGYNDGVGTTSSTRDIQGTGTTGANLTISDGATYNYGNVANGASVDKSFTITNAGGYAASSVNGTGLAAPFSFKGGTYPGTGGTCGTSLGIGATCTVVVTYNPSSLATHNDTLVMDYNDGADAASSTRDIQGTGVAPASLALSDGPTYDYGTLSTGATADKTFTVTNSGAVTATSVAGSGIAAPFTFKGGSFPGTGGTCTATLNASSNCTVVVTYAPSSTGLQTDTLDINYNNGVGAQTASVNVQGTGAAPAVLTLSDGPTYNYGTKANGSATDKSFTLTNSGGVAATSVAGSGLAAPFAFKGGSFPGTGGNCTNSLAASGTCTIVVTYSPTTNTTHNDTLDVTYNDGSGAQSTSRDVTGTAVAPASLTFSDAPSYDFGTKAVGSSTDKTFTITNGGSFSASAMSGSGLAAPFTFKDGTYPGTGGTCSTTLAAAGTCTIVVTYAPSGTGAHADTIDLSYNNGASVQVAQQDLDGAGATPATLTISDGATYNFGNVPNGGSADKTFTITHSAGGVGATSIGGSGLAAPFTFKGGSFPGTGGTCTATLAVSATCTVVVTYAPTGLATHNDTLDITYNNGATGQTAQRDVQGTGVAPATLLISDGPTHNFGTLATGATAEKTFTVTNTGSYQASSMAGSGLSAPYTFKGGSYPGTAGTCNTTLAASGTCTIVVVYAPTLGGTHNDTIDITYNDGAGAQTSQRDVTGIGASPASIAISDGATYDYGTRANGSSTDKTFTLTNSGGVAATSLGAGGLAAPFNFKGGSYPGTGGDCSTSLSASSSCTIVVTFSPASTNSYSDSLDVTYNDGVTTQTPSRAIQGASVAPANLTISDGATYDFGTIANNSSVDKTFTVTNAGAFTASSMGGSGLAAPFTFKGGTYPGAGGTCSTSLAPAGTCTVIVTFNPTATGSYSDTMDIGYNNGATTTSSSRDMDGAGAPAASLAISDGPTYDYGSVPSGTSNDKTFTVSNSGGVSAASIAGSGLAAPFTFKGGSYPGTGGTCTTTLAASSNCTIVVNYSPSAVGTLSDTIILTYHNGAAGGQTATGDVQGTAVAPATLTITDGPTYNFGTLANGASAEKTFTVNNSGSYAATSVSGGGLLAPYSFKGGSFPGTGGNCSNTLSASASCTIVVTFAPGSSGTHNDTIEISYNDGATAQMATRDVTGVSAAPALLTVSEGPLYDYGTVATTTTKDRTFTITNSGGVPATALSGGGLAAPYDFKGGSFPGTGGTCTGPVAAGGGTCTVVVTFAPSATATYNDTLEITYTNGVAGGQLSTRDITGAGALPASISISDNPSYDYGTVPTGGTKDRTFTLNNTGGMAATSLSAGGLASPFNFKGGSYPGTGGNCSTSLNASTSCTIVVTFSPVSSASFNDTILVSYNDGAVVQSPSRDIQGVGASPALLTLSDGVTYNYGTVVTGSTNDKAFTVTNSGGVAATSIAGAGLAAPYDFKGGIFPGTGGDCGTSLGAGGTCLVVVTYSPGAAATHNDTIEINYNDGVAGQTGTRPVTGTAVAPAQLTISDGPTYDFGNVYTGQSGEKIFTIQNTGGFSASSISGTGLAAPFLFKGGSYPGTGGDCGTSLSVSATCSIVVLFSPSVAGPYTDAIDMLYNNGANATSSSRNVQGTALVPDPPGAPTGLTFTITASSQLDLTWLPSGSGTGPITYSVLRSTTSGSGFTAVASSLVGTSYQDTGVTAGTTYYYKIRASGPGGTADSAEGSGIPLNDFTLTSVTPGDRQLSVVWGASTGATSYTVKYGTTSGTYPSVSSTSASSPHVISSLTAGTTYYVMVTASNATGSLDAQYELSGVPYAIPVKLASGYRNRSQCAILSNGGLKCWGQASYGMLGNGADAIRGDSDEEYGDNATLSKIGTGRTMSQVSISKVGYHSCGILDDGTIKCWGRNQYGQLGYEDTANRGETDATSGDNLLPVDIGSGLSAVKVSVGTWFSCALADDGYIRCWGRNNRGQLGVGHTQSIGDGSGEMGDFLTPVPLGTTSIDLAAGEEHVCAILTGGSVKCWGRNNLGQLGIDNTTQKGDNAGEVASLPAVNLGVGRTAVAIDAGSHFTCALLDDASVKCWGSGGAGRLGQDSTQNYGDNGTTGSMTALSAINLGTTATQIATGAYHACAVLTGGSLKCWGNSTNGSLGLELGNNAHQGDASGEMAALPTVNLGVGRTAIYVAAGFHTACAMLDNNTTKCWGQNNFGQTGNGDENLAHVGDGVNEMGNPLPPIYTPTATTVADVTVGREMACHTLSTGSMMCFGHNNYGRLLIGEQAHIGDDPDEMGTFLTQVNLGTGRTATEVAMGGYHTCAILDNGQLKCWGRNTWGQLGKEDTVNRTTLAHMGDSLTPINLGSGRTAVKVATGLGHSCAILDNGSVKCWGRNNYGQLGYDNNQHQGDAGGEMGDGLPAVNLGATAVEIQAGLYFTCARLTGGNVKCWGRNNQGQIGIGSIAGANNAIGNQAGEMAALNPINLGTGHTAVSIATGDDHVCAVRDDGSVVCWGNGANGRTGQNGTGDIGDGAGEMGDNLNALALGTTATKVVAGQAHTCAILTGGTMKCWGAGGAGRRGSGSTADWGHNGTNTMASLAAVNLPTGVSPLAVSAGIDFTCFLGSDYTIRCFGGNAYGQIGIGNVNSIGDAAAEMGDNLNTAPMW